MRQDVLIIKRNRCNVFILFTSNNQSCTVLDSFENQASKVGLLGRWVVTMTAKHCRTVHVWDAYVGVKKSCVEL